MPGAWSGDLFAPGLGTFRPLERLKVSRRFTAQRSLGARSCAHEGSFGMYRTLAREARAGGWGETGHALKSALGV